MRAVLCQTLPELSPGAPVAAVLIEWFEDGTAFAPDDAAVIAREQVMRGAAWLDARWREGGPKLKHMAFARRADGLTQAEFAERWRAHAGTVGSITIPDDVRGQAYVQNHPVPGEWAYDAVTEVWFDDVEGLRKRVEFFRDAPRDELFGEHWFLAVREELVLSR